MKYLSIFPFLILTCFSLVNCTSEDSVESTDESNNLSSKSDTVNNNSNKDTIPKNSSVNIQFSALEIDFEESIDLKPINTYQSKIYVLGWSPDGKFAYIEQSSGIGMADWDPISVVIQDLVTDKIVYTYHKPEPFEDGITTVDSTLIIYYDTISNTLKFNEIRPIASVHVENTSELRIADVNYSFHLNKHNSEGVKLSVKSSEGRKAVLYSEDFVEPGFFGLYSAEYYGYIVSPDSSRAAILILQETIELEGARVYTLKPIGCTFSKI